jgi:hypothetical protein
MAKSNFVKLGFGNFLYLLISLILFCLSYPILIEHKFGEIIIGVFFNIIFFSSIYAIGKNRRYFILALILTFIAISSKWLSYLWGFYALVLTNDIVDIICFAIIAGIILSQVLKDREITLNEIYGAICVYLLIGLALAFAYSAIDYFHPGAFFIPKHGLDVYQKLPYLIYFSFITLTSTGYGDIYPVNLFAMSCSYIETIIGQVYLVVLIGWLVGIFVMRSHKK